MPSFESMTAIAAVYIPRCGFAIGADGRARWSHSEQLDEAKKQMESDEEQKIFEARGQDVKIAYGITGTAYNDDKSFSVMKECQEAATSTSRIEYETHFEYVQRFCGMVSNKIAAAHTEGRFDYSPRTLCPPGDENLILRIMFCGYLGGEPFACDASIFNEQETLSCKLRPYDLQQMFPITLGSARIAALLYAERDWRFRNYRVRVNETSSLQEAVECVGGYLRACSTPLARRLDPFCEIIGGQIHIATLSPQSGFQWAVAPKPSI